MYYHHYPQNQFMTEEEAEQKNYIPHHPYHRYYETHYMGQPLASRFMIPHLHQQRPMFPIPPHKAYPINYPQYLPNKMYQEVAYPIQDENINVLNVKTAQHQECAGISRKGISKKNNTLKNIVSSENSPKQKKQTEISKAKMQKKEQVNRVPLKKMANGTRGNQPILPNQQILSSDPLIRSFQQIFPSISIEGKISTDNATLDQIDQLVKQIPSFYNNEMRETMKCLTYNQEKLVCNKIKEYKPLDIFDEIVKISPEFDLKGLSMVQLNQKLQQINNKFEESQLKYQLTKQQEKEAFLKQQQQEEDENNVQLYIKELKKKEVRETLEKQEDTPRFLNNQLSFEKSISNSAKFGIKNDEFLNKLDVVSQNNQNMNNQIELNSMKQKSNLSNTIEVEELMIKPAISFSCAQYSSPKKGFCENMSEEKKLSVLASRSDRRRVLMLKNNENSGHSGSNHSQAKLLGINGNINNFISPFRPTISNNIDGLSPNHKKILHKSASRSCSSFKKTECQFMDFIDNVIVNADGNFGEDDMFHKNDVAIFNNGNIKSNSDNKNSRSENNHSSFMTSQNQSQLHLHVHHHHYLENSNYQKSQKKYFDSNRVHNFIADEDDYENIQPFAITQFSGSKSQSYHNCLQQIMSNSNQKPYQPYPAYNISSFLREIDDINTFNQPGFL